MSKSRHRREHDHRAVEAVAGNGLIDRRAVLGRGILLAGTVGAGIGSSGTRAGAEPLADDPWSVTVGETIQPYELPSRFEKGVGRALADPNVGPRVNVARTPHHMLNGTNTPNGLHFVVAYGGAPDIDPIKHHLVIHGLVNQPMVFTLDALARYPMISRAAFIECAGNSSGLFFPEPVQASVQALHGLVSCAEWTGVKLSTLFEETGLEPRAKWFIAEGADAHRMSRSVPVAKALDDAMIALLRNPTQAGQDSDASRTAFR